MTQWIVETQYWSKFTDNYLTPATFDPNMHPALVENWLKDRKMTVVSNDGQRVTIFDGHKVFVASDFGHEKLLVAYDLKPQFRYLEKDGVYYPSGKGDTYIDGYYPYYQIRDTGKPVFIGPRLNMYLEPQLDIDTLAKTGQLRPAPRENRLCQKCGGFIPIYVGANAKFCSIECGLITTDMREVEAEDKRRERQRIKDEKEAARLAKILARECRTCGGHVPVECGANARYCCVECGLVTADVRTQIVEEKLRERLIRKAAKLATVRVRCCRKCNGPIPSSAGGRATFCSVECGLVTAQMLKDRAAVNLAKKQSQSPVAPRVKTCDYCRRVLNFKGSGNHRFCSDRCRRWEGPKFPIPGYE